MSSHFQPIHNTGVTGASPKILLVEDTTGIRKLLSVILTQANFEVHEAENGEKALESLSQFEPDIILSDIMMPVMDGKELLRRVKADVQKHIPVLMLSADSDRGLEAELVSLGAEKLLQKMGAHRDLIQSIREVLSKT